MEHYAITIARGFGSGGREIASALADELGIHSYENRILTLAARYSGRDEYDFVEVDEKLRGSYLKAQLGKVQKLFAPKAQTEKFQNDDRLFEFQAHIIKELVRLEDCIIVGKCADYVLKDCPRVLRIYIGALPDYCTGRIAKQMNVTETEAERLVERTDRYRADYYKYYTNGRYWKDPENYDLMINSAALSDGCIIRLIITALEWKIKRKAG